MAELAPVDRARRGQAMALLVVGLAWMVLAGGLFGARLGAFGSRPVYIHVRWTAATGEADQRQLEARYGLLQPEPTGMRTWGYTLADQSSGNIKALVQDAAVEDTHYIHRTAFRTWRRAPWRPYVTPYPSIPIGLDLLTLVTLLLGASGLGVAALDVMGVRPGRGPLAALRQVLLEPRSTVRRVTAGCRRALVRLDGAARRLVAALGRSIPNVSAEAAAVFRMVFGLALIGIVLRHPTNAEFARTTVSAPHAALLHAFEAVPAVANWIPAWMVVWGALFVAGAMVRVSYPLLVVGFFAWVVVSAGSLSHHTFVALEATVLCLLGSRWGDAWSVDAWRRRGPARGSPRDYGYTVWLPGVILGIDFLAAAVAKLIAGPGWILNGTVKYHFLTDSPHALVDWGLQVGLYPGLAVFLSLSAIVIEGVTIVGALARRYAYRLVTGLAGMGLLLGFLLFQGLFWPGYWVLLVSFLPWHLVGANDRSRSEVPDSAATAGWPSLLRPVWMVLVVMALQTGISTLRVEVAPFFSSFDMYATTYTSTADYDANATRHWLVGTDDAGRPVECPLGDTAEVEVMTAAAEGRLAGPAVDAVLRRCLGPSVRVQTIALELRHDRVDWARWRLTGEVERRRLGAPFAVTAAASTGS